jgi:S1-C subfamily serine protease
LLKSAILSNKILPLEVKGVYITNEWKKRRSWKLKEGDIIQSIDGYNCSSTEFSERIARHRPDDIIKLSYLRDGKVKTVSATLGNTNKDNI